MEQSWDYLIVLDACRYDFFNLIYSKYLNGNLQKVYSLGSSTIEWCIRNFTGRYNDVVYISANPYINSFRKVNGFKASDHFHKVVDVWKLFWNEKLGTVHPKDINNVAKIIVQTYKHYRFIIHYLQPHAPYIGYEKIIPNPGFPRPNINLREPLLHYVKGYRYGFLARNIIRLLSKLVRNNILSDENFWNILTMLRLPPYSPMDAARRALGKNGLRIAYYHNLMLVLKYVSKLVDQLSGKIIVTSDHGELLGEDGMYSHASGRVHPKLLEIPWFVVKNNRRKS